MTNYCILIIIFRSQTSDKVRYIWLSKMFTVRRPIFGLRWRKAMMTSPTESKDLKTGTLNKDQFHTDQRQTDFGKLYFSFCVSILGLKPIFCYIKTLFATKVCKNDPKICGSLNFFKSLNKIVEPWSPSSQTTNKHVPSFAF